MLADSIIKTLLQYSNYFIVIFTIDHLMIRKLLFTYEYGSNFEFKFFFAFNNL